MNNSSPDKENKSKLDENQVIALMGIYANEWIHRDALFWKEFFTFFYANLIIIIFPNIAERTGISFPDIGDEMFRIVGIIMAGCLWYITVSNSHKLLAAKIAYEKMMEHLGDEKYKRVPHTELERIKTRRFFSLSVAQFLAPGMFICLIVLAIALF